MTFNRSMGAALAVLILTTGVFAAPKTFKVVGERLAYRNIATVESESDFETFTGKTSKVSGSIKFDPETKTGGGTLEVDVASIETGIGRRDEHLRGQGWMEADKYPTIKFETTKVQRISGDDYRVSGKFTLHGVTKTINTKAKVRYRAFGPEAKKAGFESDVLQISTKFNIKLSDYGIKVPEQLSGKVNNTVTISLSAYATA